MFAKRLLDCRFLLTVSLAFGFGYHGAAQNSEKDYLLVKGHKAHPTRVLAKFKPGANTASLAAGGTSLAVRERSNLVPGLVVLDDAQPANRQLSGIANPTVAKSKSEALASRIKHLSDTGLFEYVEPDFLIHLDTTPSDAAFAGGTLWGLQNTGQNGGIPGADIGAVQAWDITTGAPDVIVAVIDSGIRYTHRDLAANMWRNPGEIPGNGIDDDGDGYVDNVFGIDALNDDGDPMDDNGHGTHVAGTIGAAANDDNGHVGVAWNVRLMGCKFLGNDGSGKTSDAIKCIDFAVNKGARVLNNSWGGGPYSQALYDAIAHARERGVLFVVAAGNDGTDNDQSPQYPSNYPIDNIISVAAVNRTDQLAGFSNFGQNTVHLGAPGVEIFSTWFGSDIDYKSIQGTSMATPHVAGVAALVLSRHPGMVVGDLRRVILEGVVPVAALQGKTSTGGRLNAFNALNVVADGNLELTIQPPPGSTLLAGSLISVTVSVSDIAGVSNATISANITGSTNLAFNNAGTPPDTIGNDANYSAALNVPPFVTGIVLNLSISAPGKNSTNLIVNYAVAVPAANNNFDKRSIITGTNGTASGSSLYSNKQAGEPNHAGNIGGRSLWWTWTAPASGRATFSTVGSKFDTLLAVYTGTSIGSLALVAQNDDFSGSQGYSLASFNAVAGTNYQIALDGFVAAGGDYQLQWQLLDNVVAPANDNFANATVLSGGVASISSSSVNATKESSEPAHVANAGGASIWFLWTAPASGLVGMNTAGSGFDTLLAVYTGSTLATLTTVAGNDDDPNGGLASRVSFTATAGQAYRIAVDGYDGVSGNVSLALTTGQVGPANDSFQNAITINGTASTVTGSNSGAVRETGEPDHAGNSGGASVWWFWTAPSSGVVTLDTSGSAFDTLLAVYTGSAVNALTAVASNDDAPGTATSRVSFYANSGTTYRIAVDGYRNLSGSVASGGLALNLLLDTGVRPANDNFASRITLAGNVVSTNGNNIAGTKETNEPSHAGNSGGRSVWWTWTAPLSGLVDISTGGSSFDTLLAVYTGTAVSALSLVGSNDDNASGLSTSRLTFLATQGITYQIAVDGYDAEFGTIVLNLSQLSQTAFSYSTSFNSSEGYSLAFRLAGQNSWLRTGSGGDGLVDNFFSGGGYQAYIGFNPPSGTDVTTWLYKPINVTPATNQMVAFLVDMSVVDSTNARWDVFRWGVFNQSGQLLFRVSFDNNTFEIFYVLDDGVTRPTGLFFNNSTIYRLGIVMDFANNLWGASLNGSTLVSGQPVSTTGLARNLGDIDAGWGVRTAGQPGDNYMLFDNYSIAVLERLFIPAITTPPQSLTAIAGTNVNLTVAASGTSPLAYQWYRDDEPIPGATSTNLLLSGIQTNQTGRYWVVVTNYLGSETSQEAVVVVNPYIAPPANDDFASRTFITGTSNVVSGVNRAATKEATEPTHAGNFGGKSVWWSWTAPSTGAFIMTTAGSDFDTLLAVYTGNVVSTLALVANSDDAQSQTRSGSIVLNAISGAAYQIAVDGYNGDAGNVRLAIRPMEPLAFSQPFKALHGGFQAVFAGEPGIRYLMQVSTNLSVWTTLTTVVGQDAVLNYLDTQATNSPMRFYRAVREP